LRRRKNIEFTNRIEVIELIIQSILNSKKYTMNLFSSQNNKYNKIIEISYTNNIVSILENETKPNSLYKYHLLFYFCQIKFVSLSLMLDLMLQL
jgi:hypothetical protein